ncbi:MAG: glutamine synthetase III [Holosporaceae bacterium]|jgi:glutamine synthetase|nr:glutamine synthetase III [Holosporaceae bacterium]
MKYQEIKDIFQTNVFNQEKMCERLPANIWKKFRNAMNGREKLEEHVADVIASAMKEWAISRGATHWTHWFHPLTGMTAEKHNAFLKVGECDRPFHAFRGRDLLQSEPDASSFPSGGMRSTFQARGYSAWDICSPAFIIPTQKGGTLCIPSIFLSFDGTPLDVKTALLKALRVIDEKTLKLMHLLGHKHIASTYVTVGAEQEFFLLDKKAVATRPDLIFCNRTIIGTPFPKDQTLDAHYFSSIPPRIISFMEDVERDLARVGVIVEARHNEVAPGQYEFCPKFVEANLACDQNQLIMETMKKVAIKHDLVLLLHEKPFDRLNGSGKHINISMCDNEGNNLLQPSNNFEKDLGLICLVAALTYGVAEYHDLLNAIITTPGNTLRLGGHEAPPNIISIYLGKTLDSLFKSIAEGNEENMPADTYMESNLKNIPTLLAYSCERNRTSPLAFTGNKFEFRAPGASQALARPITILTAVWASGIEKLIERIEENIYIGMDHHDSIMKAIRETAADGTKVRFEGDCYSKSWHEEAKKRKLKVPKNILESLDYFIEEKNVKMLFSQKIFSRTELEAYRNVGLHRLCNTIETELIVIKKMMFDGILPAISKQIILEGEALKYLTDANPKEISVWKEIITALGKMKADIISKIAELDECNKKVKEAESLERKAHLLVNDATVLMQEIRKLSDRAEYMMDKNNRPFASYSELLVL